MTSHKHKPRLAMGGVSLTQPDPTTPDGRAELLRLHREATEPVPLPHPARRNVDAFYEAAHAALPELIRQVDEAYEAGFAAGRVAESEIIADALEEQKYEWLEELTKLREQKLVLQSRHAKQMSAIARLRRKLKALK